MTLERVDIEHCNDPLQISLHLARFNFVLERLSPGQSVLEIGTGPGTFTRELYPLCARYIGVEYDRTTCEVARAKTGGKAEIIQADARALPFPDEKFSFIVCLEVLEHLGDFAAGATEIHRCISQTGMTIISVPYRKIGGKSETNEHHPYEPGEAELVRVFKRLFDKIEVYYQFFRETRFMTMSRLLHVRRFTGMRQIYADLAAGKSNATSRVFIDTVADGMKLGLILVAHGKRSAQ